MIDIDNMKFQQVAKIYTILFVSLLATACDSQAPSNTESTEQATDENSHVLAFVDTQAGKPIHIDTALFNTEAAKTFLETGKNTYIGNEAAIQRGKKVFQLYSCTQCHGPTARGQVGPGLIGPSFKYPKNATNKGMFETIWNGTNGGMGAKGLGVMDPEDSTVGISPDDMLKIIAWIRSMSNGFTGNE